MMDALLIIAGLVFMALAFLRLLHAGFIAGETLANQKLGLGSLAICMVLMLTQSGVWVLVGLHLGAVA